MSGYLRECYESNSDCCQLVTIQRTALHFEIAGRVAPRSSRAVHAAPSLAVGDLKSIGIEFRSLRDGATDTTCASDRVLALQNDVIFPHFPVDILNKSRNYN